MNLKNVLENSIVDGIKYSKHNVNICIDSIYEKLNLKNNKSEFVKDVVYYLSHAFVQNKSGFKVVATMNWTKADRMLFEITFDKNIPMTNKQYNDLTALSKKIREMIN